MIADPSRAAMTSSFIARRNVSASEGTSYHQIDRHENVPGVSKNGDRCNESVALRYPPATVPPEGNMRESCCFGASSRQQVEREMESGTPNLVDLSAELAKLTIFRGRTPQSTVAERKGSAARLASYRDGALLASKFAGKGHWEVHPGDELIHILDGTAILEIVCDDGPPKSFPLRAGMMAVIPQGAWHRFHSSEGTTLMTATPFPGETIDLDVDDPRTVARKPDAWRFDANSRMESGTRSIFDLNAELAKLTMFRRSPRSTLEDRKGSGARLASYRDGALFAIRFSGKDHWESHPTGDELVHILDGTATVEIVGEDGPQSCSLRAGMIAVIPQGAWHRLQSSEGATQMTATPFPSAHIELDVDDPRTVEPA
jgi:mannose-6-phosphate isomerase-like protein (cupin superfamily)